MAALMVKSGVTPWPAAKAEVVARIREPRVLIATFEGKVTSTTGLAPAAS